MKRRGERREEAARGGGGRGGQYQVALQKSHDEEPRAYARAAPLWIHLKCTHLGAAEEEVAAEASPDIRLLLFWAIVTRRRAND